MRAHRPAAIVLDLMMPVMSGWEFLAACGDELLAEHIPVAVVSAEDDARVAARRPTVSAVLSKPVDLDLLTATLHRLIAGRAAAERGG